MQASRVRGLFLVAVFLSWSAHAQGAPPTDGPPPKSDVIPSDSALPPPPSDVPRVAEEQYDEQAIGFDDFGAVVTSDGAITGTVQWSSPYQGKYKKPLVGADFYRALGRSDLVKQYEDRAALKTGLLVGGGLALLAGTIAATVIASSQTTTCSPIIPGSFTMPTCTGPSPVDPALGLLAVGGIVGGGIVLISGAAVDPDPVGTVGKRQLAEAYNRELWERLSTEPHADGVDVHVAPHVEKDGGGVSVAVRF
ncbi:MAG TPA: hypothetical protein VGK85_12275 [Myxococcaceae bacterium]